MNLLQNFPSSGRFNKNMKAYFAPSLSNRSEETETEGRILARPLLCFSLCLFQCCALPLQHEAGLSGVNEETCYRADIGRMDVSRAERDCAFCTSNKLYSGLVVVRLVWILADAFSCIPTVVSTQEAPMSSLLDSVDWVHILDWLQ